MTALWRWWTRTVVCLLPSLRPLPALIAGGGEQMLASLTRNPKVKTTAQVLLILLAVVAALALAGVIAAFNTL